MNEFRGAVSPIPSVETSRTLAPPAASRDSVRSGVAALPRRPRCFQGSAMIYVGVAMFQPVSHRLAEQTANFRAPDRLGMGRLEPPRRVLAFRELSPAARRFSLYSDVRGLTSFGGVRYEKVRRKRCQSAIQRAKRAGRTMGSIAARRTNRALALYPTAIVRSR
jgi:hypothetical protein